MKRYSRLLPHWCQILGYSYLVIYIAALAAFFFLHLAGFTETAERGISWIYSPENINVIAPISIMMICLACFSREKVEDEMIASYRLKSISYIALTLFAIDIMRYMASMTIPESSIAYCLSELQEMMAGDFTLLVIAYLAIFKATILWNRWRIEDEK